MSPIASEGVCTPVVLRELIATFDSPEGIRPPVPPSGSVRAFTITTVTKM